MAAAQPHAPCRATTTPGSSHPTNGSDVEDSWRCPRRVGVVITYPRCLDCHCSVTLCHHPRHPALVSLGVQPGRRGGQSDGSGGNLGSGGSGPVVGTLPRGGALSIQLLKGGLGSERARTCRPEGGGATGKNPMASLCPSFYGGEPLTPVLGLHPCSIHLAGPLSPGARVSCLPHQPFRFWSLRGPSAQLSQESLCSFPH